MSLEETFVPSTQEIQGRDTHIHPHGISSNSPHWLRNRKLTVLYYRSCGMSITDIAERCSLNPRDVRRYIDEILESGGI